MRKWVGDVARVPLGGSRSAAAPGLEPEGPRTQGCKGRAGQAGVRARGEPKGKVSCVSWLCSASEARQMHRLSHGSPVAVGHPVAGKSHLEFRDAWCWLLPSPVPCVGPRVPSCGLAPRPQLLVLWPRRGAVLFLVSLFRPVLFLSQLLFYPEVSAGARSDGRVPGLLPRCPPQPAP